MVLLVAVVVTVTATVDVTVDATVGRRMVGMLEVDEEVDVGGMEG